MADSLFKRFSATEFTADGAETGNLFDTFDPAQDQLLEWIRSVMSYELQGRGWTEAVAGTAMGGRLPVESVLHREPERALLKSAKVRFPLLYIYPEASNSRQRTLERSEIETTWRFGYVMGGLAPEEYERVAGVLRAFPKLIEAAFKSRAHPAHDDGADQFDVGQVNFSTVSMTRARYGAATWSDEGTGMTIYVSEVELVTTEVEGDIDGAYPDVNGFELSGHVDGVVDLVKGEVTL
jgi:hypothetical protein